MLSLSRIHRAILFRNPPPDTKDLFSLSILNLVAHPFREDRVTTIKQSDNRKLVLRNKVIQYIPVHTHLTPLKTTQSEQVLLYTMNRYSTRRSASPISYSTKQPRWERSNVRSQPQEVTYRVKTPEPASAYNSLDPETYAFLVRPEYISDTSGSQGIHLLDAPITPIYISSSPIPEEATHEDEETTILNAPIYVPGSPIQPSIEFDELNSPVYLPPGLRLYGDERDYAQYVPRPNIPYHPTDQPLIWSSEVNVQILPTSPPYHPSTPTRSRTLSPTSPSMNFIPVPLLTYDNPEYESTSPRYRTQEDEERDYFLLESLSNPEIQAIEMLEENSLWRRRWVVDYGSDADDEGDVGGC